MGSDFDRDAALAGHLSRLHAFVRLRAGRVLLAKESVSDLVQSACREVLADADSVRFDNEGAFRHWLFLAAERKIVDRARHWKRAKRDAGREAPALSAVLDCYASFCTPSRVAAAREELERVERAFAELPDNYRDVIVLSRVVGLARADIAKEMGRTEASVRSLLYRALARLSSSL